MPHDPGSATTRGFILQTYSYYASLMQGVQVGAGVRAPEGLSLGGQLFWAGELDETGRALAVAGNISGASTLSATSDLDRQRLAVRDGVVDFLVNSLDEGLRILKNEVRKRETVAVCVAAPLEAVEGEMVERGVRPDVFREGVLRATQRARSEKRAEARDADAMSAPAVVTWSVNRTPAFWLPKIDAIALECLGSEEAVARRWLLRSSRYLGRLGQREHLVLGDREFASRFFEHIREAADRGQIKADGRVEVASRVGRDLLYFGPRNEGAAPQA